MGPPLQRKQTFRQRQDGNSNSSFADVLNGHRSTAMRATAVDQAGAAARPDPCTGSLVDGRRCFLRHLAARDAALIWADAVWLAVEPLDMRAGTEAALRRVVAVFGAARPAHA